MFTRKPFTFEFRVMDIWIVNKKKKAVELLCFDVEIFKEFLFYKENSWNFLKFERDFPYL